MGEGDRGGSHAGERPLAGIAANVVSFAAAASGDALTKFILVTLAVPQTIALRGFFFMLLLSPAFALAKRRGKTILATRHPWLNVARVSLHLIATACGFLALSRLPLTTFTAILFTAPIFVAIAAIPLLGERVRPHQWIAIALGFVGCFIILQPTGASETFAVLLALGSAATWALSVVLLRRLAQTESRLTLMAWGNLPHLLIGGALAIFDWRPIDLNIVLLMVSIAAMQIVGQFFTIIALRAASAATVAPVQYTQILWATIIGAVFFNERPAQTVWIGAAFIVAAGFWLMRSERTGP